ncbi:enoyl-CoA hydratase [Nitrogeniibacter mangrovi]|uniref:Enoyl-CoA hydratase n=1 Tax=Nitrogeniibacter mangrovi TaxID=2016596 RepID=A0A6C1AZF4_9RHOO|nr:enoyl-CoA hydratase-related protein [Nitrogeniibacter mangrovi]QID16736.1 enoyl-CoA hydratase [Nitrogeniibacter mangrovi]
MADTVLLRVDAGIATMTLNRPDALNALSVEMMQDLAAAARAVKADARIQVLVIEGAGAHFVAGGDINDFARHLELSAPARLATFRAMIEHHINPTVAVLQSLHQPVIAKVRGACAGFGLSLMLGCDLAIAADDAKFTCAYAGIGLPADGGMSHFLPRMLGRRKAMELLLLADRFDAAEALRLGLVSQVVAADGLDAAVLALAQRLQAGARHAYAEIKRLLNDSFDMPLETQLQSEAEAFARCAATRDFAEGVGAFLDKRKPRFEGR